MEEVKSRHRRPRGSLTSDLILDAAEQVACDGFEHLTMRAVAAQLDAAPMALYRHFATKQELVQALLDRVLGRFETTPPTGDWRADLRSFARAHRRVLDEHAWTLAALFSHPNPGLNAIRIGELALGILRRAGFSDEHAFASFSGLLALNYGWSSFASARASDPAYAEEVRESVAALPAAEFPHTVAAASEIGAYGSNRHYELALDQMLNGIGSGPAPEVRVG